MSTNLHMPAAPGDSPCRDRTWEPAVQAGFHAVHHAKSAAASSAGKPGRRGRNLTPSHPGAARPPFDSVTIGLHWTTAALVLALFATAWLHQVAEDHNSSLAPLLIQAHRSLGVIVWALTALRLTWRLSLARLPPFPAQMTWLHRAMVKLSEYALYALLLGQPATGLVTTLLGGRPFALLVWQVPPLLPRDEVLRDAFHATHEIGAWTLAIVVAGHAGVALFHHFVLRDDVLACMTPGVAPPRGRKES
jgi:cytochrome b561